MDFLWTRLRSPHCWRQRSLTQVVFVVGHSKERFTHTGHRHTGMSVLTTCVYTLVQGCMHTPRVYTQAYVCSPHVHRYRCTHAHTCVHALRYRHTHICTHIYTHTESIPLHTHTHTYICTCTHAQTYTHTGLAKS